MKALLKAAKTSEGMKRIFRFCEGHKIKILHSDIELSIDRIQWYKHSGSYYGSSFNLADAYSYFKFEFSEGPG